MVADDLLVPNGAVVTPAGDRLIVAETMAQRLTSFHIAGDGSLDDRRYSQTWATSLPTVSASMLTAVSGLHPSGSTRWSGSRRAAGSPTGSPPVSAERLPACSAAMIGRDLYVCATRTLDPAKSVEMCSGAIELCRVDVPGAGLP